MCRVSDVISPMQKAGWPQLPAELMHSRLMAEVCEAERQPRRVSCSTLRVHACISHTCVSRQQTCSLTVSATGPPGKEQRTAHAAHCLCARPSMLSVIQAFTCTADKLACAGEPAPRRAHAGDVLQYRDSSHLVIMGGRTHAGAVLGDVWAMQITSPQGLPASPGWQLLWDPLENEGPAPAPRKGHVAVTLPGPEPALVLPSCGCRLSVRS